VPRPPIDLAQACATWRARVVPDPSRRDTQATQQAIHQLATLLRQLGRRLTPAERRPILAAAEATLAGPRDFSGDDYNRRLDRCWHRAHLDHAVCDLLILLRTAAAPLAPEVAAILGGTRVASCNCCEAGFVANAQHQARNAAVRTLSALGPRGLALLPPAPLLHCFTAHEPPLARLAAELLARHVGAAPQLAPIVVDVARSAPVDDPWLVLDLCRALARAAPQLGPRDLADARRFVTRQLRHPRDQVRAAAVRALAALGAREPLERALRDDARSVRYAALRALGRSTRDLCRRDARRT
jgi:HEAT repeats